LSTPCDTDESVGIKVLAHALAEPMRVIVGNAGIDPEPVIARARGCRQVFDVLRHAWVDPWTSGLVDPLAVVSAALDTSVSAAAVGLTADVLIHRPDASVSTQP
jgi:chaperonin GroEL